MSALSTAARDEYYAELANSLPTPVIHTREYCDRRLATAVEAFEALRPADAYEARLAVRIVLCGAHAAECLREADCYRQDYAKRTRCRAQAASMMRGEGSAKRMLEREQKVRLAVEAVADGGAGTAGGGGRPAATERTPGRVAACPCRRQAAPPCPEPRRPPGAACPGRVAARPAAPATQAASPPAQAAAPAPAPSPDQAAAAVKLSVRTAAAAPPPALQPPATPPRPAAANRARRHAGRVRPAALARGDRQGRGLRAREKPWPRRRSATTAASRRRARRISAT